MANPWEMEWDVGAEGSAPWEQQYEATGDPWDISWDAPVDAVYEGLAVREGVGDTLTDVPTGALGVTEAARKAIGDDGSLGDEDVARMYLAKLQGRWEGVEGYQQAPAGVQEAILDASYNMGEQVLGFNKLKGALAKGNYEEAVRELLDTASVDGKGVKGLAKRRAEMYNAVATQKITDVEQLEDGTIIYRSDGEEVFKYRAKGGRHEKSDPGIIAVDRM